MVELPCLCEKKTERPGNGGYQDKGLRQIASLGGDKRKFFRAAAVGIEFLAQEIEKLGLRG